MSDSPCLNAEFVSFQLAQCLGRLIRMKSHHILAAEDWAVEYEFFVNNNDVETGGSTVFGDPHDGSKQTDMQRWIDGLQDGEPISLVLLCKALERADLVIEMAKDEIYSRKRKETYDLEKKIETLKSIIAAKEEKLKEKAKKTEPKKKASKAKKGAK